MEGINPNPGTPPVLPEPDRTGRATAGQFSFGQLIGQQLEGEGLKFSAHARERLSSRGITLDAQDLARLQQGVAQAAAKGSKEALVLKDNVAFVVSVKNNTVITAVDADSMQGNVFTHIDSAVIV